MRVHASASRNPGEVHPLYQNWVDPLHETRRSGRGGACALAVIRATRLGARTQRRSSLGRVAALRHCGAEELAGSDGAG